MIQLKKIYRIKPKVGNKPQWFLVVLICHSNNNLLVALYIVNFNLPDEGFLLKPSVLAQDLSQVVIYNILQIGFCKPPASQPKH